MVDGSKHEDSSCLDPSSTTRLNRVSEDELRQCLLKAIGHKVAEDIIRDRANRGQVMH